MATACAQPLGWPQLHQLHSLFCTAIAQLAQHIHCTASSQQLAAWNLQLAGGSSLQQSCCFADCCAQLAQLAAHSLLQFAGCSTPGCSTACQLDPAWQIEHGLGSCPVKSSQALSVDPALSLFFLCCSQASLQLQLLWQPLEAQLLQPGRHAAQQALCALRAWMQRVRHQP